MSCPQRLVEVNSMQPPGFDRYLETVLARLVILSPIAVPKAVKAPTTATAISAAATAYSDNSSPVSSNQKFFITISLFAVDKDPKRALAQTSLS